MKAKITPELLELFDRYRLSTARGGMRWQVGETIGFEPDARIERYAQALAGWTLPLALGAFSYSHSPYHRHFAIGRYCSLSWGIEVIEGDHPMDWATTSPVTHAPADVRGLALYLNDIGVKRYQLEPYRPSGEPVTLGHDVWIGMRALIKRGVTIGHGAVVGAGSLVTHDVPPYAIVAGTPARILRYRFPDALIERLLRSEWWLYGPEKLQPLGPNNVAAFLDKLEDAIAAGLAPIELPVLTGAAMQAAGEPA